MNRRVVSRYEMFTRVVNFGKNNKADFVPKGTATAEIAALEKVVTQLAAVQDTQKDSAVISKSVLLDALRLDAKNVWRTAYAIGQNEAGFASRFKQPEAAGEGPLLLAVDATIAELEKPGVAAKFTSHELPRSFLADLKEARAAVAAARTAAQAGRESSLRSTTLTDQLIAEGLQRVTTLNAIMHNKYSRVPEKLRAWKSAIHIERVTRSDKAGAQKETAEPASV